MNRKEKEKLLLDSIGVKVGDIVSVNYINDMYTQYRVEEESNSYCLFYEDFKINIDVLLVNDFKIIKPKKTKGDLTCNECKCDKCPLRPLKCNMIGYGDTLYVGLDKTKEIGGLDDRVYSLFKEILDEEIE